MAVPTIISLDKTEGYPSGNYVVTIVGTGFAIQGDTAPSGMSSIPDSVKVTLSEPDLGFSAEAKRIRLVSETSITFEMPKMPMPMAFDGDNREMILDVTVQNLDSNGDPITGEVITLPDSFTVKRRCLSGTEYGVTTTITQYLVALLRHEVLWNTSTVVHTEYDRDTDTKLVDQIETPNLSLLGPDVLEPQEGYRNTGYVVDCPDDSNFLLYSKPEYYDLAYTLIGVADTTAVILNLQSALIDWMLKNKSIQVPKDLNDPSKGHYTVWMDFTFGPGIEQITSQYPSNTRITRAEFTVRGVPFFEGDISMIPQTADKGVVVGSDGVKLLCIEPKP